MSRRGQIIKKPGQEHRQELAKLIKEAAYMHATWQIWDDLTYFAAAALAQPTLWVQKREDEYIKRAKQYNIKTQELFTRMFAEIVLAFEQEGCVDILGDMYMQLELFNKWTGQYFTPSHLCELMAKMTEGDMKAEVEKQGYISVCDPCCGGGAMLIAFAKNALEQGINYQRDVLFVGQDIDPVVARMCYISMALLGMPGYVIVGNSLLMDTQNWEYWFTPMYFVNGFSWRKQKTAGITAASALEETEALVDTSTPGIEGSRPQPTESCETYTESNTGQLSLF